MKPVLPLAIHAGVVLLLARRSGAAPCTPLELDAPIVVDDTAGALQLAAATNCSGGAFNVSWVGSVTVEDTIRVADGTTLSVVGTPDGSSIVSGTGQGSLFEVIGGTLLLSGLSLANGNGASSGGGGIYAVDSVLAIDVCAFEDNVGDFGGGIFLKSSRLDATESTFKRNFAPSSFFASSFSGTSSASLEGAGGAVYAIDSIVTSDNCDFSENGGGAFYMIESVLVSDSCTFSNNFGDYGGGLHLERSVLNASGSNFTGHFANNGGAIYSYMSIATISGNTTWENNNVTDNGGAIGAEENSTLNILGNSLWAGNYAEDSGAGVYVHTSTADILGNTIWVDNSVNDSGGAIYAKYSTVNISGSAVWTRNSAAEFGGAVAAEECVLTISGEAEFRDNVIAAIGYDDGGGGLGIYEHSTLEISNHVEFVGNLADNGGGLWAEEFVNITISGSATFEGNEAEGEGGGVWLGYGSRMDVLDGGSVHCSRNDAELGGGIFCDTAVFVVQGQATFFNNSAVAGAGVFLNDGASLSFTGNNVTVAANNASLRGGGVYAEATTQFVIENAAFLSNFARTTGGAMSLLSVGTTSNFRDFDDEAKVVDCRFAGNEAGESGGAMSIAGGSVEITRADFVDNTADSEGGAVLASGVAEFDDCTFDGNRASSGLAISNTLSATIDRAEFRNNMLLCDDDSEFVEWEDGSAYEAACEACDCINCTTFNPDKAPFCDTAMEHTASLTADGTIETLDIAPGYWRSSRTSREIRECYEADACVGGSEEYCKTGHGGPFCAVCLEGYAAGSGYTCSKCTGARRGLAIGVGLVLLVLAAIVVVVAVSYLGSPDEESAVEEYLSRRQTQLEGSRVSQGLKIIIVSWQIVSQFSSVASVTYPDLYGKFVEHISFLDLDLTWMLSANCFINTNFYHHLLTITIGPLVVCGLVLASYRRSSDDPRLRCDVKRRHATVVYIISVLVYSSASSAVFQTFACDDLDNGKSFLRADHSIQCDTTAHKLYKAYAGVMCLLYPLGIPFCYAAILYPVRECLKSDNKQVREKATVLRALAAPYRKEVYYYEVVECLRRVTLSGLVVFILPNTAGQVITTFLLSLFFFAVFMGLDPHELGFDKWLDRIGHAIVMMSMFVALAVKVDIERDDEFSQEVFAGALVVANCVMVLTILVESCMVCLSDDVSMGLVNFTPAGNFIREAWGPVRRAGR